VPEFTAYAHGTPCWVDVTSTDIERTNSFYGALFGWEAQDLGEEAGGYTMYRLGGKDVAAASPPMPGSQGIPPHWTTYIASDDADTTATKVRDAGGTVVVEPFDVFDSGRMAIAADPTGATFGIWQAREHIGAQLANEPGTQVWNECHSPDPERAAAFYADVFGCTGEATDLGDPVPYRTLQVDGRSVAGVWKLQEGEPPNWTTVFSVAACDDTVAQARQLGAEVVVEPFDIPSIGRYAVVRDPVGAVFGVLSPPA
jgi:predicted enzyme related to lactoylglutathione lyase